MKTNPTLSYIGVYFHAFFAECEGCFRCGNKDSIATTEAKKEEESAQSLFYFVTKARENM